MFQSVWSEAEKMPAFETLHGKVKTDVLIIGGGGRCVTACPIFKTLSAMGDAKVE